MLFGSLFLSLFWLVNIFFPIKCLKKEHNAIRELSYIGLGLTISNSIFYIIYDYHEGYRS